MLTDWLDSQTKAEAEASSSSLAAKYSSSSTYMPYTTTAAYGSSYTSSADYGYNNNNNNDYSSSSTTSSENAYYTSSSTDNSYYSSSDDSSYSTSTDDSTSTLNYYTTTSSAYQSYNTYGSGSSNWGSQGYDNCVQQCIASFGAPPAAYTPPPSSTTDSSSGSGVTHTIIVAPTQGVLRYVPFATNASVGDTIKFMWNANMHTVTKSSQAEICNKTDDAAFASGVQNKSFVFTQTVNSTDPTFFYCGVPTHCQKGMFGIINPPSALTASSSVSNMMPSMINSSSDIAAMAAYTAKQTEGDVAAANWGNSIDLANVPTEMQSLVAENVMYVRTFLASNPDVLKDDGSIDLSATNGAPLMIPQDLSAVLASSSSSSAASEPTSAATSSAAASSGTSTPSSATSGARGLAASSALAGAVAFVAAALVL